MVDVAWSPFNQSVFASIDCTGRLDLWNLCVDSELPIASVNINNGGGGNGALNKLSWSKINPCELAIGDDQGRVYVYTLNEKLTQTKSKNQFSSVISELEHNYSDLENINNYSSGSNGRLLMKNQILPANSGNF